MIDLPVLLSLCVCRCLRVAVYFLCLLFCHVTVPFCPEVNAGYCRVLSLFPCVALNVSLWMVVVSFFNLVCVAVTSVVPSFLTPLWPGAGAHPSHRAWSQCWAQRHPKHTGTCWLSLWDHSCLWACDLCQKRPPRSNYCLCPIISWVSSCYCCVLKVFHPLPSELLTSSLTEPTTTSPTWKLGCRKHCSDLDKAGLGQNMASKAWCMLK